MSDLYRVPGGVPFFDPDIHRADDLVNALPAGAIGFAHGRDNLDLDCMGYVDFRAVGIEGAAHGLLPLERAEELRDELDNAIAAAHMAHKADLCSEAREAAVAAQEAEEREAADTLRNVEPDFRDAMRHARIYAHMHGLGFVRVSRDGNVETFDALHPSEVTTISADNDERVDCDFTPPDVSAAWRSNRGARAREAIMNTRERERERRQHRAEECAPSLSPRLEAVKRAAARVDGWLDLYRVSARYEITSMGLYLVAGVAGEDSASCFLPWYEIDAQLDEDLDRYFGRHELSLLAAVTA